MSSFRVEFARLWCRRSAHGADFTVGSPVPRDTGKSREEGMTEMILQYSASICPYTPHGAILPEGTAMGLLHAGTGTNGAFHHGNNVVEADFGRGPSQGDATRRSTNGAQDSGLGELAHHASHEGDGQEALCRDLGNGHEIVLQLAGQMEDDANRVVCVPGNSDHIDYQNGNICLCQTKGCFFPQLPGTPPVALRTPRFRIPRPSAAGIAGWSRVWGR